MNNNVPGFQVYPGYIDIPLELKLITEIDAQTWVIDYDRRLQYYGYRNELAKPYGLVPFPVPFPKSIKELAEKLFSDGILSNLPNQVIINEYPPGQGIRPHKDRNYFSNQICGVNLGSGCVMRFIKIKGGDIVDVEIPQRSVYIMQDDARYKWNHAISPRKKDTRDGQTVLRQRRVSITYRTVRPEKVEPINPEGKVAVMLRQLFKIDV